MPDLQLRETSPPDWDGVVVELWEDDVAVGQVFLDDGRIFFEPLPDDAGEIALFDVSDLLRALDLAARVLAPDDDDAVALDPTQPDPLDVLASEFDSQALFRGPEDEGFYPLRVAGALVARAESLDLAVTDLEGFDLISTGPVSVAECRVSLPNDPGASPWVTHRASNNVQALAVLERWPQRDRFVVSVGLADRNGEEFLM